MGSMGYDERGMAGVLAATAIVGKPNSVRSKVCCGYHRMGCRPDVFLLVLNVGNGWEWWLLG